MASYMQRSLWALVLCLAPSVTARANVIYDWVALSQIGQVGLQSIGELVFTDAAVASGSFALSEGPCPFGCPPPLPDGLIAARGPVGSIGPLVLLNIDVSFQDGTLSGTTNYNDLGADFFVRGSRTSWSGVMDSDSLLCQNPNPCQVTGFWERQDVPEPASLTLFGAAIVALTALGLVEHRRKV